MTRSLLIPALALGLAACSTDAPAPADTATETAEAVDSGAAMGEGTVTVGDEPEAADYLPTSAVMADAASLDGETVAVEGTITKVCQQKGCWMTLETEGGETFRVVVPKDDDGEYVFTFPMDVSGATAQLAGTLVVEEESVETLRHLAEDGGADEAAVAAITEPRPAVVLTATGARLIRS